MSVYELYLIFREKQLERNYFPWIIKSDFEVWKHKTALDTYCITEPKRGVYAYVPYNMVLNYIDVKPMYGVKWHSLFIEKKSEEEENVC